jgi:nucleotide-binding universal stress UspA family protein
MRIAKILLPIDFSERSIGAAHYAHALAMPFQSEVIVLHVVRPLDYAMGAELTGAVGSEWYATRLDDWRAQLEIQVRPSLRASGETDRAEGIRRKRSSPWRTKSNAA